MNPTDEEKKRIREAILYNAATGYMQKNQNYSGSVGFYDTESAPKVLIDDVSYVCADICWFLHYRQWPTHGVVMSDKSPSGRLNLQLSNLRRRRKPEYVKKGRAVWVPRDLMNRVIHSLRTAGVVAIPHELEELMANETKR